MTIYRTSEGHEVIRAWCAERLERWHQPHENRMVDTALGATHVLISGSGPGMVLVPGTNFSSATWLDLVAVLAENYTVYAVDLPGQPGLSSPVRPSAKRQVYGHWLTEVLHEVGAIELVVGHSLGAAVALSAAVHGGPIRRLLLVDPAGIARLRVPPAVLGPTLSWLRSADQRNSARLLQLMLAPRATPTHLLVEWMALVGRHVRTSLAPAPLSSRDLERVRDVRVDVLVGRHDIFLPQARLERAIARRLPSAPLEVVDGAGHLLPHERPDAILRRVHE